MSLFKRYFLLKFDIGKVYMKVSIKRLINPTLSLSVIVFGITIIIWGIVFLLSDVNPSHTSESILSLMLDSLLESNLLQNIVVFLISALNALLILQLNNRFTIIRTRTFMPVIIYLLLISVWKETHDLVSLHFTLSLIIGSFFVFFNMFRNKEATEQAFLGSFFIGVGSLFIEPIILIIPVCWLGFIALQCLSLRTWLASMIGTLSPWILYFAVRYFIEPDLNWVYDLVGGFELGLTINFNETVHLIYLISIILVFAIGFVGLMSNLQGDSLHTRAKISFQLLLFVFSFIFSLIFKNMYLEFMLIVALTGSILMAHPLTLKPRGFYAYLFYIFVLINLTYLITNVYLKIK